ncbi:cobalt ECF transporter T component CbiQ [Phycicoccus sp. CSK15P-2]|uniref:cobalt ECF transporter T component CbiQ n=1 Tax=Phycicoccus sp. CSK15P-2 TaxID=2807627 RepID=UPI00195096E7|nr:cobalt ECF transporter T component CbiQ [Phycicoccus sp. CSK15P-2]MBM6404210.1 cobalt ECF transporter T component CbiQ [Phycicoccus sp. CSK15P-2]
MARLAIDDAAWGNRWRTRSTGEKALLALGLLLVAVTTREPGVSAAVLVVAVTCALAQARVPWRTYLRVVLAPATFVVLGAASIAVTVGSGTGDAVWSAGPVAVTEATLARAAEVLGRSLAATSAMALLATTTPLVDLVAGMRRLRVPEAVVDVAEVMYRFVFLLLDTLATVREAQASRLGYGGGRAARRSLGMLASTVFVRAWTRAQRLEDGLAGRGGTGSLRTLAADRPVSVPFVLVSGAVLAVLSTWSVVG